MNYGDKLVLENNSLEIVVYWHGTACEYYSKYSKLKNLELCSIQNCKYINPFKLQEFIINYKFTLFDKLMYENLIEKEKFYLVKINFTGYDSDVYNIVEVTDVSTSTNEFHHLH